MDQQLPENKLPIPRLVRPSSATSISKKGKPIKSPGTKLLDKRLRDRHRIYLGDSFQRWRDFRVLKGIRTDAALATFLLNR